MTAPQQPALNTLEEGLTFHTVDELKKLLQRLPIREKPTRKAELVAAIAQYLRSPNLKKLWKELNKLQQAAVAEAVYATGGRYLPEQFRAKYGQLPEWDTRSSFYRYGRSAELLDLFFYPLSNYYGVGDVLPEDLRLKLKAFVPEPQSLTLERTDQPPESIQVEYSVLRLPGTQTGQDCRSRFCRVLPYRTSCSAGFAGRFTAGALG